MIVIVIAEVDGRIPGATDTDTGIGWGVAPGTCVAFKIVTSFGYAFVVSVIVPGEITVVCSLGMSVFGRDLWEVER